jgi:dolichol-phosphate mannosyltransferase
MVRGLFTFWLVCGFGAAANVGVASFVFRQNSAWWASGLTGAAISAVWNYAASSILTWPGNRARPAA